jgi:hypothetical protein
MGLTTINSLLEKTLFNFMHGICFDYELQEWFDLRFRRLKFLKTLFLMRYKTRPTLIQNQQDSLVRGKPSIEKFTKSKKGNFGK